MYSKLKSVHFVGIGGIGMSGIAEVLLTLGYRVSGSDLKASAVTERLARLGATIQIGHRAENVAAAEVVVTSSAIAPDNPEVAEARRRKLPVIQRAEMLAELMRLKYGIAVAGMHGKTTTTSMIASVLAAGGLDPTVVVGGRVDSMDSNARLGKSEYLVAEADESDRSFLKLSPILAVVTNLDREHMDCYRDLADIEQTFLDFMNRVPFYGAVVACGDACGDDARLRRLLSRVQRRVLTYGAGADSDFRLEGVSSAPCRPGESPRSRFSVRHRGASLGGFCLNIPGAHNLLNATAAVAVGVALDVKIADVAAGLENFRGVDRRFQLRGDAGGVSWFDDYGHHPTEVRATLEAARQCGFRRIHVVFQPHRYTRTQHLAEEFAGAFSGADSLHVLDIYPASEMPIPGVTGEWLAGRIRGIKAAYAASFADAAQSVAALAAPGDMVLTLGAGNVAQLGPQVLALLGQSREAALRTES